MHFLIRELFIVMLAAFSLLVFVTTETFAQIAYPSCASIEPYSDNIELVTSLNTEEDEIALTVFMQGDPLQHYYGFAFIHSDQHRLPAAKKQAQFYQYFNSKTLLALQEKAVDKDGDRVYGFKSAEEGHWMIYLIASLYPIDFLEQKRLQIQPNIELERGGGVFSGSSLNLVEPIDYKVCSIHSTESVPVSSNH